MKDAYKNPIPRMTHHRSPAGVNSLRASVNTAGSKQGSATVQEKNYQTVKGSPNKGDVSGLTSPMRTSGHTKSSNILPRQIKTNTHQITSSKGHSIVASRNKTKEISITENDSKLTDKNTDFIDL